MVTPAPPVLLNGLRASLRLAHGVVGGYWHPPEAAGAEQVSRRAGSPNVLPRGGSRVRKRPVSLPGPRSCHAALCNPHPILGI